MDNYYTEQTEFYGKNRPDELINRYGSPLYVYNERILRERCREVSSMVSYPDFRVNYSTKANSNLTLLKIIREEGLLADAMSPGEIYVLLAAGYIPEEIFFISNNVSAEEMRYAIDMGVTVSVDSISQLRLFGRINPGGRVAVRLNPGIGAGHHEKVVTAGENTKFGVNLELIQEVKDAVKKYQLKLVGINQHIGSLFMDYDAYIKGMKAILLIAEQFDDIEFVDLGGGFGIPYRKQEGEERLNLNLLGEKLNETLGQWAKRYGKNVMFKIEPGRYIVAECGVLLGTVHAVKQNYATTYIGTDIGFNVLARPVIYNSHHEIEVYGASCQGANKSITATVVGNICESGDILAKGRALPKVEEGNILGIMDSGAYGYVMSSNYNNRLRPAEVLIRQDGSSIQIRRRDTLEDLIANYSF